MLGCVDISKVTRRHIRETDPNCELHANLCTERRTKCGVKTFDENVNEPTSEDKRRTVWWNVIHVLRKASTPHARFKPYNGSATHRTFTCTHTHTSSLKLNKVIRKFNWRHRFNFQHKQASQRSHAHTNTALAFHRSTHSHTCEELHTSWSHSHGAARSSKT